MIPRQMSAQILEASREFPAIAVTGPRQSGKTTLCRELFPKHAYVNLEKPDVRQFALEDPNGFLGQFSGRPVILDEAQRAPELFSYIMPLVDEHQTMGEFVLSGSQNFHLQAAISQSLAGRCATLKLLPLSHRELCGLPNHDIFHLDQEVAPPSDSPENPFEHIHRGSYPPLYARHIRPSTWYSQYTQSYLERDVRTLVNVGDLETFGRFLRLAAGRSGQILNYDSLATDAGISPVTAKRWISLLAASYVVFLLKPHSRNFNKRLVKTPKLYFYDTGLLCSLLNIRTWEDFAIHSLRGAIFETYIVSELMKACYNQGVEPPLYYWRDSQGHEVDLLIEDGERLLPIEIKSAQTISSTMFEGLHYWNLQANQTGGILIYGGDDCYSRNNIQIRGWKQI